MRVIALLNPAAGSLLGGTPEEGAARVREAFARHGVAPEVVVVAGGELAAVIDRARAGAFDVIAVGGGDGSLRTAASRLAGTGLAMAVLPLGTFNHFAKDLDVPLDLEAAVRVAVEGEATALDIAEVNGRVFINHAALGLYPSVVHRRERLRRRTGMSKFPAMAIALAEGLRDYPTVGLRIRIADAAATRRTPFVFIGNNRYILESYGIRSESGRDQLALVVAHHAGRWALLRMAMKAVLGSLGEDAYDVYAFERAVIESRRRLLLVELDGEIESLAPPLAFRLLPGALNVIRQRAAETASPVAALEEAGHGNGREGMDWDRLAGNWMQMKGRLRERWGRLTDDELNVVAGRREQLIGRLQELYGISAEEAERQLGEFERTGEGDRGA